MEEEAYESLPENHPWKNHMIAGAAAGMAEHLFPYPIDLIKTQQQCLKGCTQRGIIASCQMLANNNSNRGMSRASMRNFWRGSGVVAVGAAPAHALHFSSYELVKKKFSGSRHEAVGTNFIAPMFATVAHDLIMSPVDAVKQRMQVRHSTYASCRACVRHVAATEGFKAFYRSMPTVLIMSTPYNLCKFNVYERCQKLLNPRGEYNIAVHFASGIVSSALAAFITTPLDVCKTLLNTQRHSGDAHVRGLRQASITVYACGWRSFFRGAVARMLTHAPSGACCWVVYESLKLFFAAEDDDDESSSSEKQLQHSMVAPAVNIDVAGGGASSNVPSITQ